MPASPLVHIQICATTNLRDIVSGLCGKCGQRGVATSGAVGTWIHCSDCGHDTHADTPLAKRARLRVILANPAGCDAPTPEERTDARDRMATARDALIGAVADRDAQFGIWRVEDLIRGALQRRAEARP